MEGVTIETIREQQKARNRTLLQFLFQRSYVERIGQGFDTVFDECAKAGLPEPILRTAHGNFNVSLSGHDLAGSSTTLPGLKEHHVALPEIVDRVNKVLPKERSKRSVQEDIKVLIKQGRSRGSANRWHPPISSVPLQQKMWTTSYLVSSAHTVSAATIEAYILSQSTRA